MKPYKKAGLPQRGHIDSASSWSIMDIEKSDFFGEKDFHGESRGERKDLYPDFPTMKSLN